MDYYKHYKKWHDHNKPGYIESSKERYKKLLKDVLPEDKNAKIMEIGCANGMALLAIQELGYSNICGVELSPELSRIAKSFGLNVIEANAVEYIKIESDSFDFIFMIDVLEHIEKGLVFNFLLDIYDKLSPDGKLLLVIPNAISPAGTYYRYIDWTHETSFTPTSIQYLLENAGFSEIVISEQHIQEEPNPEKFEKIEWYEEALKNYRRRKLYLDFVRWQATIFFGKEAKQFPLTPNMQVIATKGLSETVKSEVIVEDTPGRDYFDDYIKNINLLDSLRKNYDKIYLNYNKRMSEIIEELEEHHKLLLRYGKMINQLHQDISKLQFMNESSIYEMDKKLNNMDHKIEHRLKKQEEENSDHLNDIKKLMIYAVSNRKRNRLKLYGWKRLINKSGLFDAEYYLRSNPDVKQSSIDPIKHYILHGAAEGRNPSRQFNTIEYMMKFPELLISGENPLVHYIKKRNFYN